TLTLTADNSYSGALNIGSNSIHAVPFIRDGGANSPLGASSNAAANLQLGGFGRGDLLLTATVASFTNRGATLQGLYGAGGGGGIGVQSYDASLRWFGQLTGTGSLIKTGAGGLALHNTTNNYA